MSSAADLSPEERTRLIVSVGTHRGERPYAPLEVAGLFRRMVEGNGSVDQAAEVAHASPTMVRKFLSLLDLPSDVQDLVGWGATKQATLGFSVAAEIARAQGQVQGPLADVALKNKVTRSELKQALELSNRSALGPVKALSLVLEARPKVTRRFILIGQVWKASRSFLSMLSQVERDRLLLEIVEDLLPGVPVACRLGLQRLSISGEGELEHFVRSQGAEAVEKLINAEIEKKCSTYIGK